MPLCRETHSDGQVTLAFLFTLPLKAVSWKSERSFELNLSIKVLFTTLLIKNSIFDRYNQISTDFRAVNTTKRGRINFRPLFMRSIKLLKRMLSRFKLTL